MLIYFISMSIITFLLAIVQLYKINSGSASTYYDYEDSRTRSVMVKNGVLGLKQSPLTLLLVVIPAGIFWPMFLIFLVILSIEKQTKPNE